MGTFAGLAISSSLMAVLLLVMIGIYALFGFVFYKIYKKAAVPRPWLAFVPIGNLWPFFWTLKRRSINVLWLMIPSATASLARTIVGPQSATAIVLNLISLIIYLFWYAKFFKAFRVSPLWLLMMIGFALPIAIVKLFSAIGLAILFLYMGFSKNVQYTYGFDGSAPSTGEPPSA